MSGLQNNLPYRPCVVAVFKNDQNQYLVCERSDVMGAWQFPQGGIEANESAEQALSREIKEELGDNQFKIIRKSKNKISYQFPSDFNSKITQKYRGQIQDWFLLEYERGHGPKLEEADGEFRNFSWEQPQKILSGIISWKREAYVKGFFELGIEV